MACRLMFSRAEKDLNKVKKYLEDCSMKVMARPSGIHNIAEKERINTEQESLDGNFTNSTVCMPQSSSRATFDCVDHEIVRCYGIVGSSHLWFTSYLSGV